MVHPDQDQGFVKTLDVVLTLASQDHDEMARNGELNFWKDHLRQLLEEKSVLFMPFRIIFKKLNK
jgi:hypothetical protein